MKHFHPSTDTSYDSTSMKPASNEPTERVGLAGSGIERPTNDSVCVYGRFIGESQKEYLCRTENIDEMTVVLSAPVVPMLSEHVIVYLDGFGRIEGTVTDSYDLTFTVDIMATSHKRRKIRNVLTSLRNGVRSWELQRHSRMVSPVRFVELALSDGTIEVGSLVDISLGGALIETNIAPSVGDPVQVGPLQAHVLRHTGECIAVKFRSDVNVSEFGVFFEEDAA